MVRTVNTEEIATARASIPASTDLSLASSVKHSSLLGQLISFPAMLGSLLLGAIFWSLRLFFVDPDLWWHVKVGQEILTTHRWPTTDPYSFTVAGQPWIAYEWLGEVLLAAANRVAGIRGLDALLILLGFAVLAALYALATIRSGNAKAGFAAVAVLIILATPSFSLRPQMLGYLFLVLTLIALVRFRQGKGRALWFLPVLFLLWVNTHGSFVIGMGAIAAYYLGGLWDFRVGNIESQRWLPAERQRLSLVFLLCLIALMITPYGTSLATYPFDMAFSQPVNVANILEWQPMPFNLPGGKLFLALLIAFMIAQATLRLKWRPEEFGLFLFGTAMACLHLRFILIFVPFCAPLFATILARWTPPYDRAKDLFVLNAAIMALVAAGMIHYFPSQASLEKKVSHDYPVDAVAYLRQHPAPGPMYNTYGFGGYLVWSMGPEHKVFLDGRGDVYERGGVLADYLHIADLKPGAFTVLQHYGIQSCLLERDEVLATALGNSPEWKKVYSDQLSALFVRTDALEAKQQN
jgi:hypothetical protein